MIKLTGLMLVDLTDAEILCLHKWMWTDMQKELGNNPGPKERMEFKFDWCYKHRVLIKHNCFLCEHAGMVIATRIKLTKPQKNTTLIVIT